MTDPRLRQLVRALNPGQRIWLSAEGNSLWPFALSGDQLHIERCTEAEVRPGDVALIDLPHSLVAHIVIQRAPVVTSSSVGVIDPSGYSVLGRVVALRRGSRTLELPRSARFLLAPVPKAAQILKNFGPFRSLVRWLRDS